MVFQNSTPIFEDTIEEFLPKVLKSIVSSAKGRVMAAQTWEHFLGTPCSSTEKLIFSVNAQANYIYRNE